MELMLNKNWYLKAADGEKTLKTDIPADIATVLLDNGEIADPYYERNELESLWVGEKNWIFSTEFFLNEKAAADSEESAYLMFPVIDTVADIFINGEKAGECRNMFLPVFLDVSGMLKTDKNTVEVIIHSPSEYTKKAAGSLPYPLPVMRQFPWQWPDYNLLRKPACHGGWDWGITLLTGGIYQIPVLFTGAGGRVENADVSVYPEPGTDVWNVDIECRYVNLGTSEISIKYIFDGKEYTRNFKAERGENRFRFTIKKKSPELWWPNGYGKQKLYNLSVEVSGADGKEIINAVIKRKTGFRTVELVNHDDEYGRSMFFKINGREIFAKGANWIPADAFPSRQTESVYRRLLEDAASVNMNMIRLWGGGQYEKDIFYELCDTLGLMVWHDFMFSCALYPSDREFLDQTDREVRFQVNRLKSHPSIVLWCGNNENLGAINWFEVSRKNRDRYIVDYDRLYEGTIGKAVKEEDPHRPWWPSSPSAGEGDYSDCWHDDTRGDMHYWSVWHEGKPFESYYDVIPRFCSEFGFQSFPSIETVRTYISEEQFNITSPAMRHHQKHNNGNSRILSTMASYYRMPSLFEDVLYLSQVQQAAAMRTAIDYWRAMRPVSMGALYWQLNDLWPVASWSGIDYTGRWKLLHYEAARFFAPVRLSLFIKNDVLFVYGINDTSEAVSGRVDVRLIDFNGKELNRWEPGKLECAPDSSRQLFFRPLDAIRAKGTRKPDFSFKSGEEGLPADMVDEGLTDRFIVVDWYTGNNPAWSSGENSGKTKSIAENIPEKSGLISEFLFLTKPRDCSLAKAEPGKEITLKPGSSTDEISVESSVPVFYVEVSYSGKSQTSAAGFSDSNFFLIPGRPKKIKYKGNVTENLKKDDLSTKIKIRHLSSIY